MRDDRALSHEERGEPALGEVVAYVIAAVVFIGSRWLLIFRRDEHIDELFTVWLSRKEVPSIIDTLREDSGPPLYYALMHGIDLLRSIDLQTARFASLALAVITLIVVLRALRNRAEKILAALLMSVYPHHVYFSGEARSYALCALFIGIAAVALDRWAGSGDRRPLYPVTLSMIAAAYSNYYGVLFFPVPIVVAFLARDRVKMSRGVMATVVCTLAFIPGFILAAQQPESAVLWMRIDDDMQRVAMVAGSLLRVGFEGRQPIINDAVTTAARVVSAATLILGFVLTLRSRRAVRFLVMVVVPIAGAIALAAFGMTAYFPLRFEVVLTVPFILWFVNAAMQLASPARNALVAVAVLLGGAGTATMLTRTYLNRAPERLMARNIRLNVDPRIPLVASGLSYIELAGQSDRRWSPVILPYPRTYDLHPVHPAAPADIERELPALPREFLWVGKAGSNEENHLRRSARVTDVSRAGDVVALAVRRE